MTLYDALKFKQESEKGFERFEEVIRGVLVAVDDPDSAAVSGQAGRVWVQLYGEEESPPVPIFNREVPTIPDTPVLVKRSPKAPFGYEIVSWEAKEEITRADGYVHSSFRNPHAREHEIGGRDPLFIYLRALTMLRCSPTGSGFKVSVPPTNYPTGQGTLARFPGHNSFDLAAHQPASGSACLVLVYLDTATNTLDSVAGSDAPDTEAIIPPKPAIPEDAIPSAYVRLSGDATRLFETDVIEDLRAFVNTLTHNAAKIRGYKVETGAPAEGEVLTFNGSTSEIEWMLPGLQFCSGRLTLTSNTPILTSNVTGATTIYLTPHHGNRTAVYTGSRWKVMAFNEISVTVPATVYRLFDIFEYDNGGVLALQTVNWNQATGSITGATNATPIVITSNGHGLSNNDMVAIANVGGNTAANGIWSVDNVTANTFELEGSTGSGAYTSGGTWYKLNETRATALTRQDGIYVKSGDTGKRYRGTGMTTGTSGQIEMTGSNALLWNYYNRVFRPLVINDGNNHTYTSATTRVYRNVNSNKIGLVMGVVEDVVATIVQADFNFDSGDGTVSAGMSVNRTGALTNLVTTIRDVGDMRFLGDYGATAPSTGYTFLQLVQSGAATSPDFRQALIRGQMFL
jgi:hypothetical protein